ncbi:MAG: flagellar hook-length control protein FliK [Desulfosporosinus sp.]|nr:flagellar hook-length control protein FliK [Desulfosporosinus sp.]
MAGIYVLSDTHKANSKLKKTPTLKEIDVTDSPENATASFAAMLSGSINQNPDSKGQYSAKVGLGQDIEKKQSTDDSVQSAQDSNGLGSLLAYGSFVLPLLTQPMYQGDLPAGKEANSGNDDEVTVQSGMTAQKTQGDNPGITELDKYRQVIGNLLGALSGEITNTSGKGTLSSGQKGMQSLLDVLSTDLDNANPELNAKASTLLAALYPILSQGAKGTTTSPGVKDMLQAEGDMIAPMPKGHLESLMNQAKGIENDLIPAATAAKDTVILKNIQQKATEVGLQESNTPKNVQGIFSEEIHKEEPTRSSESPAVKVEQNQSSSALSASIGIGISSNIVASNVAEGKTTAVPVWEQISTVLREHVINRSQDLKQLDIQLHPADLGKIQIDLRWENGQVHLQVQASQAATGQLLQNHLSDLRQALSNQGVNCGMLQMGQGGAQQQGTHGDESRRTFMQNIQSDEDEDLSSGSTSSSLGPVGMNRINVTA